MKYRGSKIYKIVGMTGWTKVREIAACFRKLEIGELQKTATDNLIPYKKVGGYLPTADTRTVMTSALYLLNSTQVSLVGRIYVETCCQGFWKT